MPVSAGSYLSSTTDQSSQGIIINQGANQGISEGLPVIIGTGVLIGKISAVEENTATVLLITDNYCLFNAKVSQENTVSGITRGQHGLSINLELIPKTETIAVGQIIVTAGTEENIPADLLIGTVEKVDNPPSELWQTAILNPYADLKKIDIVNVLLPSSL